MEVLLLKGTCVCVFLHEGMCVGQKEHPTTSSQPLLTGLLGAHGQALVFDREFLTDPKQHTGSLLLNAS